MGSTTGLASDAQNSASFGELSSLFCGLKTYSGRIHNHVPTTNITPQPTAAIHHFGDTSHIKAPLKTIVIVAAHFARLLTEPFDSQSRIIGPNV